MAAPESVEECSVRARYIVVRSWFIMFGAVVMVSGIGSAENSLSLE